MNKARIAETLLSSDAVLIGASNGLSICEGLNLFARDRSFSDLFGDFMEKYGFSSILEGFFYPFPSAEAYWAYISRLVCRYSGSYRASLVMEDLKAIIGSRPYFVLTSNAEGHFTLAGFDPDKVFELEGNWLSLRCSARCHEKLYPSMPLLQEMNERQRGCQIPSGLIPRCPLCGAPMKLYDAQPPVKEILSARDQFLQMSRSKNLAILELGIGWRNQLIKAPLMRLAAARKKAVYITVNLGEVYIPEEIRDKSFGVDSDLGQALFDIRREMETLSRT